MDPRGVCNETGEGAFSKLSVHFADLITPLAEF